METKNTLLTALNSESSQLLAALNFEFSPQIESDDTITLPEWIELLPAQSTITGRDGRTWSNPDPQKIVDAFYANQADIPIDIEHATELKAPEGEPAPAVGWIKDVRVQDGSVYGRVEWTEIGADIIEDKTYKYLSPVFTYTKDQRVIVRITSIGLTNQPNLFLKALNQAQKLSEDTMDLKALAKALGLPENASFADCMTALNSMKSQHETALNQAQNPSLDKFVPRTDYAAMEQRALNAEKKLSDAEEAETTKAINAEVDAAIKAGKIAPASKDYHIAACRQEGGLERFKSFVAASPVIAADSDLDGKEHGADAKALNSETKSVAEMMGNSIEDIEKFGK